MNKREMICYGTDASRLKGIVQKVVFPQTIQEVAKVIKSSKFDIVPRGSGTNLVGGVIPNNSVVIDMSGMNRVSNYLPLRKTVRVEAGITLKELNEKLKSVEMEFPIDVYNKGISTIGGMIATNASGDRSMRYGNIREWIEEIEFVNGHGELVKTSKADLTDVCGMEGTTGVIVGATIKLAPLIRRSASAFQSDNLDEVLSIARKLRVEKEVVVLELLSPFASKLLGLPQKYNLFIEFNSNRGKIKDEKYEEISKLRENVFPKLFSEGYYNFEDPKLFFDKLKEFILFLEEDNIPYISHLGAGIIHPFFKDNEIEKREKTVELIKKMKALPGKLGIGLARKYFIDNFAAKLIQRVKVRHDPSLKFNKGKLIDIAEHNIPKRVKINEETTDIDNPFNKVTAEKGFSIYPFPKTRDTINRKAYNENLQGQEIEDVSDDDKLLVGEEISAIKIFKGINNRESEKIIEKKENFLDDLKNLSAKKNVEKKETEEKTPEEKMEDFIKEIEEKDNEKNKISEDRVEEENDSSIIVNADKSKEENVSNEFSFQEVKEKLQDYKETYESELSHEKKQRVEDIAKNIPREIVKGEKELGSLGGRERIKIDYREIHNIMTNRLDTKNIGTTLDKGKVIVTDNLGRVKPMQTDAGRKGSLSDEDRELVNKILGNRHKNSDDKNNGVNK